MVDYQDSIARPAPALTPLSGLAERRSNNGLSTNAGDRMKCWGKMGAFWGGFWELLFGSALFAIPGIGPILVAGPLVAWIVGGLEGAAVVVG
jgi:hypothetical protein